MSKLVVKTKSIVSNITKLNRYLESHNTQWTLITKVLSGNKTALKKILSHLEIKNLHSIGDSRLSNLKKIKDILPNIVTMYIKPPAIQNVKSVVEYADISLNSSIETIEALNEEAKRSNKKHRIIIMIELGELREGVMREEIIDFYKKVFKLSNIKVEGIGTNLGCMYGIEPTYDKLVQLCLYKQLLEAKFNKDIALISGGSSITLPLIGKHKIPESVNHFRIGEAAFLGKSPFNNKKFRNLIPNGDRNSPMKSITSCATKGPNRRSPGNTYITIKMGFIVALHVVQHYSVRIPNMIPMILGIIMCSFDPSDIIRIQ